MKRQGSTELPRFAVGALAIAGASAANGATVQITFTNNVLSTTSGTVDFVADLTNDGLDDVGGAVRSFRCSIYTPIFTTLGVASVGYGGRVDFARLKVWTSTTDRALVSFTFSDARINNSLVTAGYLDMEGFATGSSASLKIHRLIFDDASITAPTGLTSASTGIAEWVAVPEPSSLGLLALGAGGLLARRRRQAA